MGTREVRAQDVVAEVVTVPVRTIDEGHLEDSTDLERVTGLGAAWIRDGIEHCYKTLDLIDEQLIGNGSERISELVELANLSSMMGNLLGAGLAQASGGAYVRNRPHAYPDLLARGQSEDVEIKVALETNRPKGHLPKEGPHLTFRYVLCSEDGKYTRGKDGRGVVPYIWEARFGILSAADYDLSNTAGDSGKTAVIKTDVFRGMERVLYVPELLPYARQSGPFGAAPPRLA